MDRTGQHRDAMLADLVAEVLTGDADGTRASRTQDIHIQVVQAMPEDAGGGVMQHLNSGHLQLGVLALLFGGLQFWWFESILQKRDLARPLSEGEFRKSLDRIWVSKS